MTHTPGTRPDLKDLWRDVDALGGAGAPEDYVKALEDVIAILERHGFAPDRKPNRVSHMEDALREIADVCETRAEASIEPGDSCWVPNRDMSLLMIAREGLGEA